MVQETASPTIHTLACELVQIAKEQPEFVGPGFHIYNMEDLQRQADFGSAYPMVAVAYEGVQSVSEPNGGRPHSGGGHSAAGVSMITLLFSVVVGVEYYAAGNDDTKPCATDLLDSLRRQILGFVGVSTRPWQLVAEQPLGGDATEGVLWYGQQWATDVIQLGRSQT